MSELRDLLVEAVGKEVADKVAEILNSNQALYLMHLKIEDVLIEFRDSRMAILGIANGFVVKEADGSSSDIIRLGTRDGLSIAMQMLRDKPL